MLDNIQMHMLTEVADLHGVPEGAYNFRVNGERLGGIPQLILILPPKPTAKAV